MCPLSVTPSIPLVGHGARKPRVDPSGYQLCETCEGSTRLNRAPGKSIDFGAGKQCNKCYQKRMKGRPSTPPPSLSFAPSNAPRPRRTRSTPGPYTPLSTSFTRTRVRADQPPPVKQSAPNTRAKVAVVDLLEKTHRARLASLAEDEKEPIKVMTASEEAIEARFQQILAEEEEHRRWLIPRRMKRLQFLTHKAPRCYKCNFPRTGKKGWDEKNERHTDKNCNDNRWRTIWMFL
jgi:hypothetical protein